jgi:hypothetical protein
MERTMRTLRITAAAALLLCSLASRASAQAWPERFYVAFNGGVQTTSNAFDDRFEFEEYLETATVDVEYENASGPFFDGGFGVRLWKSLGAGVAFSFFTKENPAAIDARIPHPFFDARPREVTGEATGLTRTDAVVHLQAMAMLDPSGPLRLVLFGGPSFFRVEQDLVTGVRYSEEYPFDTATFTSADVDTVDGSAVGFNVGADVIWMLHDKVGIGGLVRFTRASIDLDAPENRAIGIDAGGFQGGGGIRIVF